jgi:hypothetical protein
MMDVAASGRATSFDKLSPGDFFKALREKPFFGICVSSAGPRPSALIFAEAGGQRGVPWLSTGRFPNDTMLAFPAAFIRVKHENAIAGAGQAIGSVVDCDGRFYMRASVGLDDLLTFDLQSCQAANLPHEGDAVSYNSWVVGQIIDDAFQQLYSHSTI